MFCSKCGSEVGDGQAFCPNCGASMKGTGFGSIGGATNDLNQQLDRMNERNKSKLTEGEEVVIVGKWNIVPLIVIWAIVFIYMLVMTINVGKYDYDGTFIGWFVLAWIIVMVACALSIFLFVARRELMITNKKVYARTGLIGIKQRVIPISKINYIYKGYTIIGRIIRSATVVIMPASSIFGIGFRFLSNADEIMFALEGEMYKKNLNQ